MRRKSRPAGGRQIEVTIEGLGRQGDGYADLEGRPLFVAQTLVGDRVRVRVAGRRGDGHWGEALELIAPGPGRREAPCPHFGPCGGCTLQHLEDGLYAEWKRGQVLQALARRGLAEIDVEDLVRIPAGTRRRAVLGARRQDRQDAKGTLQVGFHARQSHRVVELEQCLVLTPGLVDLVGPLRRALDPLIGPEERWTLSATETESGIDLLLQTRREAALADREALAAFAERADLARVSWRQEGAEAEPLVQRRAPVVTFGRVPVTPPPGGFLQPSLEGESALAALVLDSLPEAIGRIADLYCGCGTFTFRLAERARVLAVEGDAAALGALEAARQAGVTDRVDARRRDLARQPLLPEELEDFDAVLFDPPRTGAREQAAELARSAMPLLVAVSCNPATFARDARTLVDGGYRLTSVTPLDQFLWSGHVELVGRFER